MRCLKQNCFMVGVYYVYILASRPYGTLYVGVTNDIIARTYDHRSGEIPGFTKKYGVGTPTRRPATLPVSAPA